MKAAFRVDSSVSIGSGHMMRCLVLADALRRAGGRSTFVCRDLPGNLAGVARGAGHEVMLLDPAAGNDEFYSGHDSKQTLALLAASRALDWVVVDHYRIDEHWERVVRKSARFVLAVDDLADRKHACDVLLDPGYYEAPARRYQDLVPSDCVLLQGPRYALLRPEFVEARQRARPRDGNVRRVLLFFGGSDPTNQTALALEGLRHALRGEVDIDVVIGCSNPHASEVSRLCQSMPGARLLVQTPDMAALMEAADLSLGAGGVAAWERCAVRLPSIVTVVAPNQMESMRQLAARGSIWLAGSHAEVTSDTYAGLVESALRSPAALRLLSERAGEVMQGCELGVGSCVATMRRKVTGD